MKQVADQTYSLGSRAHNFYVLIEDDQATVVDAGCSREWPKLEAGLKKAGLAPEQVAGFVITHVHSDHFGMAKKASGAHIPVAVHIADEDRARGTYRGRFSAAASDLPVYKPRVLSNFLPMLFAGLLTLDHIERVETFSDGEMLDIPGHPVAVHTPGHTEGHTMFHCSDRGALFTGDGLVTMDLLGPGIGPQYMNEIFDLDSEQAHDSLDRIMTIDADVLLPGHGEPWRGTPSMAVELARGR